MASTPMKPNERVASALRREEPDRVPWCEMHVDPSLSMKLMGWGGSEDQGFDLEQNQYTCVQAKAVSRFLGLGNIPFTLRAPIFAEKDKGKDGRLFYGKGMLKSKPDLGTLILPDPTEDTLYGDAAEFIGGKEDLSAWFVTRVGLSSTMLSMGIEGFSLALYDNRTLVEEILDRYCDWAYVVAKRACELGFDAYVSTDDMAFKTKPFFSPKVFREMALPRYRRIRDILTIPWIIHSDGNMIPFMDDLVDLGIAGFHPNEKGAMDIRAMKRRYGHSLCILGNVDLVTLGIGTQEEVVSEVRGLIRDLGPGGGYIISSGNSLAGYLRPENILAMRDAIAEYGRRTC